MKHLPLKLGIFVVLLFAAVIAACLLWTPLRIKYYVSKYRSNDTRQIARGIRGLLSIGEKGKSELEPLVRDELRYSPPARRVLVADALIASGPEGVDILAKIIGGSAKAASLLAKHWAHYNEPVKDDEYRSYPLHLAARKGWEDAAELLLSKGADVNAKDNGGWTPLDLAEDDKIKSLLRARGGRTGKEIREQGNKEIRKQGNKETKDEG